MGVAENRQTPADEAREVLHRGSRAPGPGYRETAEHYEGKVGHDAKSGLCPLASADRQAVPEHQRRLRGAAVSVAKPVAAHAECLLTVQTLAHLRRAAGDRAEAASAGGGSPQKWQHDCGSRRERAQECGRAAAWLPCPAGGGGACIRVVRGAAGLARRRAYLQPWGPSVGRPVLCLVVAVEGSDKRRFFAVLNTPLVASPADAVRATIVQESAPDRDGDHISPALPPAEPQT